MLQDGAIELVLVGLRGVLVERPLEVVADVGQELGAGLDHVDVVAVALLRLVARRCVVGPLGFLTLVEQIGVLADEKIELPRDDLGEPVAAEHATYTSRALALLIRTWNVFHGNADPPEREAYLEQMVRLGAGDRPDVVCLQEVPAWALAHLAGWSGMQAFGDIAQRPRLGPMPIPAELGRVVTSVHHGLLRSAVAGQANAILFSPEAEILGRDRLVLNNRDFR